MQFVSNYAREGHLEFLKVVLPLFEIEPNPKGSALQMFESVKNQYTGKPHLPHSHMLEYGIHAITLKPSID